MQWRARAPPCEHSHIHPPAGRFFKAIIFKSNNQNYEKMLQSITSVLFLLQLAILLIMIQNGGIFAVINPPQLCAQS